MKLKILSINLALLFILGCKDHFEEPVKSIELPEVKTFYTNEVYKTSATIGGEVTQDSASAIVDRGITWSKSQEPDTTELIINMVSAGTGDGSFYATLTDLEPNSDYFVWAYATNEAGTGYGNAILVTTKFESDPNLPVDPAYPTTYFALDSITLSQKKIAYAERNKYMEYTLNEFGFCSSEYVEVESPPTIDTIYEGEVTGVVEDFILRNKDETGIKSIDILSFNEIRECPSNTRWCVNTNKQIIDSIEILETNIHIRVINGQVVQCSGNWYPEIYIPANFNFDQEQAKALLVGRIMTFTDFGGGAHYIKISDEHINSSYNKISIKIYPLTDTDKTELRVVWRLYIPGVFNILYVDVMTGEIILKEPTYLS